MFKKFSWMWIFVLAAFLVVFCVRAEAGPVIEGQITNLKSEYGKILPLYVLLLSEYPALEGQVDPDALAVVEETTADDKGRYSFSDFPPGEYYLLAYKDLNGNGVIDFDNGTPLNTAGFYGMEEGITEPAKIAISAGETYEADFTVNSSAIVNGTPVSGMIWKTPYAPEGLEGAKVSLYGPADIKVAKTYTEEDGRYIFPESTIVDGEYYIKASKEGFMPSLAPFFIQIYCEDDRRTKTYWSVTCGTKDWYLRIQDHLYPTVFLITHDDAISWGYVPDYGFIGGSVNPSPRGFEGVYEAEVILKPSQGNVVYFDMYGEIDFAGENTCQYGYFIVNEVAQGSYIITASHPDYNFFEYRIRVEEGKYVCMDYSRIIGLGR